MAYESPIKVDWNHHLAEKAEEAIRKLMDGEEAHIMYKVNLVVDVDKDELLKALRYDRGQYEKGYSDRDSEIVRCKDCKYATGWTTKNGLYGGITCESLVDTGVKEDFFCAYGERRE